MGQANVMAQVIFPDLFATGLICASPANKIAVNADAEILGEQWLVPFMDGGTVGRYETILQPAGQAAPTYDAIRTIRLRDRHSGEVKLVIGQLSDWITASNACCGTTPVMPDVNIIDPILEEAPCPVAPVTIGTDIYFFTDVAPVLTAGQKYLVAGSANGVAFTPASSGAGYTSLAAVLTFAQASWGAYGTWSISSDGDGLELRSTTTKTGYIKISVLPAP